MNHILLSKFGTSIQRVEQVIKALRNGYGAMVLDDENRENEGDIIFAAETLTVEQMALSIRYGSGIVCLCITDDHRQRLALPMMVDNNTSAYTTAFTVTIEAAKGVTTGVSAKDRVTTIHTAIADGVKPSDLNCPGHVFPLCARKGGVLERNGHTEATIDLLFLAGLKPAGILCELTNKDGSMARTPEVIAFAKQQNMPIVTITDLLLYLQIKKFKYGGNQYNFTKNLYNYHMTV
ncbi:3,4-dihydroxy-2-butanone-4-phosphate synthase [Pantoea sp. Mhis]|uniref:3,4-dihydroxy-2-butanone-4-phosphate synthase n=1 Tax=Pantoea sp. Mhis TaxID=2576759 RepID=UPI0013576C71|nr:3,4-dihydroxy-2-butanone-4-phosphate synthase [Pantoea sp. Mhis]MXP56406.1 3,4-dihydroxy-2-butanone-4-phosphate synthase [Pantoea sp. Mhis]